MNLLPLICIFMQAGTPAQQLTESQQRAVLQEAEVSYDAGVEFQSIDPVASKQSFKNAANRFQLLVNDGVENGKLWYNLGNAYLQSGEIGEAIASYKSAKRYIPLDGRLKTNLEHARLLVQNPIKGEDTKTIFNRLTFWHDAIPTQLRLGIALGCWITCFTILSIRIFLLLPAWKTISITTGVASILVGSSVYLDVIDQHEDRGVLITEDVVVRSGNGKQHTPLFNTPLSEGIEFDIVDERSNWLQIILPNGQTGWIEKHDAQVVTLKGDSIDAS